MRFVQPEDVFLLGHNTYYKFQWTEDTDRNFEAFGHFARKVEKDVSWTLERRESAMQQYCGLPREAAQG